MAKSHQTWEWQKAAPFNYKLLKENARRMRYNQTEAEAVFWSVAKSSGLGEKCRRQYVLDEYIVDFIFCKSKLVIEIDGEYHTEGSQLQIDTVRDKRLESFGFKVLRFTNQQVLFDTDNMIKIIIEHLNM